MLREDPYLFEDIDVLENKLNIRNAEELDLAEARFVTLRIVAMRKSDFKINSIFDIKKYTSFCLTQYLRGLVKQDALTCIKKNPY